MCIHGNPTLNIFRIRFWLYKVCISKTPTIQSKVLMWHHYYGCQNIQITDIFNFNCWSLLRPWLMDGFSFRCCSIVLRWYHVCVECVSDFWHHQGNIDDTDKEIFRPWSSQNSCVYFGPSINRRKTSERKIIWEQTLRFKSLENH